MKKATMTDRGLDRSRIMHNLLASVERDGAGSQRDRASEFGVALGLVNAYLNYCVKKGHIRVKKIPAQRYIYCLTPKGFAEKSRLALTLISSSFHSFRQARVQYADAFRSFKAEDIERVAIVGRSELAEIALLCAAECEITLTAMVDATSSEKQFLGLPIVRTFQDIPDGCDGAVITDLTNPSDSYGRAVAALGIGRVRAPAILGITLQKREAAE